MSPLLSARAWNCSDGKEDPTRPIDLLNGDHCTTAWRRRVSDSNVPPHSNDCADPFFFVTPRTKISGRSIPVVLLSTLRARAIQARMDFPKNTHSQLEAKQLQDTAAPATPSCAAE